VRRVDHHGFAGRLCERARKLRRWRDSACRPACRSVGESRRSAPGQSSRQMRFEALHEGRAAQRNAIEGVNEIGAPGRQRIEYGDGFKFFRYPIERHEAASLDNVFRVTGTVERPRVADGGKNAELLHNETHPVGIGWLDGLLAPAPPQPPRRRLKAGTVGRERFVHACGAITLRETAVRLPAWRWRRLECSSGGRVGVGPRAHAMAV